MATDIADGNLDHLDSAIEEVEFKTTVLDAQEDKALALIDGVEAKQRKVYFYDTKDLALYERDLVLRARINKKDDDSTVKIRPMNLAVASEIKQTVPDLRIELDVAGGRRVKSTKLDHTPPEGEIKAAKTAGHPPDSLFSAQQLSLITRFAPTGTTLADLAVLGPVDAEKWEVKHVDGFAYELTIERWELPDGGGHFYELSFKVGRADAPAAETAFRELLERIGIDVGGQEQKTPRVLRFFADRLVD